MFGSHLIKSWSLTQPIISLSSGEAEFYSMVKGSSIGLGIQSMLRQFGAEVRIQVKSDASAAIGITKRKYYTEYHQVT